MSSQSSTVAKFHHALDLLAESSPPHQPGLVMRLSELCHDLKLGGAALEEAGAELDTLQARLVQVCQQSGLNLELRLQESVNKKDSDDSLRRKQTESLFIIFLRKTDVTIDFFACSIMGSFSFV